MKPQRSRRNAEVMNREWKRVTLRDVVSCKGGTSFPPALQGREKGAIPFYKVSDMNAPGNARLMDAANNYVEPSDLPRLKAKTHEPLSVVFPKVGGALLTNKKRMLSRPSLVDNNTMVVRSLDFTVCNPHFLLMLFESINLRELSNPGPLPSINATRVYDWPVFLPPLPEQKKIAAVLLKIQRAIETQGEIIQSLRDLKKSTMQHLFTHGLRGEKTKMTEIGEIPESWEVRSLGGIADITAGGTPSRANPAYWKNGTIHWVKTGEIDYRVITTTEERITQFGLENSSAKLLPAGTLLLAMYGQGITRGKVGLLGIEAATNQACAAITPRTEALRTRFLYHYLTWSYDRLRSRGHGAQQANLNAKIVAGFPVVRPSLNEQAGLAAALDSLDSKTVHHETKKSGLQALFKTTLNKLMTGEIRVDDLDIDVWEVEA